MAIFRVPGLYACLIGLSVGHTLKAISVAYIKQSCQFEQILVGPSLNPNSTYIGFVVN